MENNLIFINREINTYRNKFQTSFNLFINSFLFWKIVIFFFLLFTGFYLSFFFNLHWILGLIFLIVSIFFSVTLLPAFYYKTKGVDFFEDIVNKKTELISSINKSKETVRKPLDKKRIEDLYSLLLKSHLLDYTSIKFNTNLDLETVYSYKYFEKTILDLYEYGQSDNYLYITSNQKELSYLLFDLFKPFLKRDVNTFYNNFFFTQKKSFKPVNYDSISREENRGTIKIISDVLPDFLNKSSVR